MEESPQNKTIDIMVNNSVRKVTKDLPEPMRDYKLLMDIFDTGYNEVSWVDSMRLKIYVPTYHSGREKIESTFSGYVDTYREPIAGFFVFDYLNVFDEWK